MHNTGQSVNGKAGPANIDIDWPEAEDIFTGTGQVVIAMIDSGIAVDHPEIFDQIWTNAEDEFGDGIDNDGNRYVDDTFGWDFVDNDNIPLDENGHRTLVSSVIAATPDNDEGGVGTFLSALIMALRAL